MVRQLGLFSIVSVFISWHEAVAAKKQRKKCNSYNYFPIYQVLLWSILQENFLKKMCPLTPSFQENIKKCIHHDCFRKRLRWLFAKYQQIKNGADKIINNRNILYSETCKWMCVFFSSWNVCAEDSAERLSEHWGRAGGRDRKRQQSF